MKNLTLTLITSFALLFTFTACGGGGGGDTTKTDIHPNTDITLIHGQSVSCSDETKFTLTPQAGTTPDITISKNTTSGITTITYNSIDGSAALLGCKKI